MSMKKAINASTRNSSDLVKGLMNAITTTDAIVVGAGSGLSTAAGHAYSGERFERNFADFIARYHYGDMYSAGFYPYESLEEYWAYWSRHIFINRYAEDGGMVYANLLCLLLGKDYFVLTTNVDHCFQRAGFDKARLFYTQGDYGLWQCAKPCHMKTYDNEETVRRMVLEQKDMRIPAPLIPYCPVCGDPMTMNLRSDASFVEDEGWHAAAGRYKAFVKRQENRKVLFLELGVGSNTPGIIKYPFWQMTYQNKNATYACLNNGEAYAPSEIMYRSICIDADIGYVLQELTTYAYEETSNPQ